MKQIDTDDVMRLKVTHADTTTSSYSHDYSSNCTGAIDQPTNPGRRHACSAWTP